MANPAASAIHARLVRKSTANVTAPIRAPVLITGVELRLSALVAARGVTTKPSGPTRAREVSASQAISRIASATAVAASTLGA